MDFKLTNPPLDERSRELWLQHIAGFIIFNDIRDYAINRIPADTDEKTKLKILTGINDAIYGLMMVMDGVTGTLKNDDYAVKIESNICLEKNGNTIQKINVFEEGDGMCMGFHGWLEGDYGDDPIYTVLP